MIILGTPQISFGLSTNEWIILAEAVIIVGLLIYISQLKKRVAEKEQPEDEFE